MYPVFGERQDLIDDEKDLFKKAKNNIDKFKNINEPTKFIIECGLDDTRLNMSQELYKCMSELGYDVSLKISAGNHNWEYWNKCIQNTINTKQDSLTLGRMIAIFLSFDISVTSHRTRQIV